jgi:hypothetical protein
VVLAAMVALVAPGSAAASAPPSLQLFAGDRSVRVTTQGVMDLGLWVAPTGGDFVIRARRPGYGRWEAAQIDPSSGATLRAVPRRLLAGGWGLKGFLAVRVLDDRGRVVARRRLDFCPASAQRVSPDGPQVPAYRGSCGFEFGFEGGFPFVAGTLSGIDRGWAASSGRLLSARGRPLRLEPGRYDVRASIRAPYRQLFDVAPDAAVAQLRVRVVRGRRGRTSGPAGPARPEPASFAPTAAAAAIAAQPDPATLPDLVALPPWDVSTRSRRGRDLLRFAGSPWNAGPGPMVVDGYRPRDHDTMQAVQSFLDRAGNVTASAAAGEMAFHDAPGHDHWHFLQFVTYRVLRPSGREVVRSLKQSFCLVATDAVDLTLPGAEPHPYEVGLGSACGDRSSIWIRETLPAGWADTYGPSLPGQQFDITGVPNGRYLLEMQVNPLGELHEVTTANNVARRGVVLGGRPGRRTVRVAPWHGIRD